MTKAHHALTRADYEAESADRVRVSEGERWGLFDRYGAWIEGEVRECDPHMCIWLTGLAMLEDKAKKTG